MSKSRFSMPRIPDAVMDDMFLIKSKSGYYGTDNGGQFVPGETIREKFSGALFPLTEKDLQRMPQGTYTGEQQKIYTNDFPLPIGSTVQASNGEIYTVKSVLDHGTIHPMRRYVVERKGGVDGLWNL